MQCSLKTEFPHPVLAAFTPQNRPHISNRKAFYAAQAMEFKMKKIPLIFLLFFCLILCTCSCGNKARFHKDVSPLPVAHELAHTGGSFVAMNPDEIEFILEVAREDYNEAAVYITTGGASIDEFGVFVAKDDTADRIEAQLRAYVQRMQEGKTEWLKSYNPAEAGKLSDARIVRMENCIIYGFLSQEQMNSLEKSVKNALYY